MSGNLPDVAEEVGQLHAAATILEMGGVTPKVVARIRNAASLLESLSARVTQAETTGRVITTAEELDACNIDAVVVDDRGVPRTRRMGNSHMGPDGLTPAHHRCDRLNSQTVIQ
jgi:hypothetical protein